MKICIIFSHYYIDNTVIQRFINLQKYNLLCDVIPIGLSGYQLLPNSIIIDRNLWPDNKDMYLKTLDWSLGDLCIYQTFIDKPDYDIYFLLEYDTAFNTPILDFFPNITHQNCGYNYGPNFDISNWYWYKEKYKNINTSFTFNELKSSGPTTCLWWHKELLSDIVNEILTNKNKYNNMFSELRLGTVTKKFTDIKISKINIKDFISYLPEQVLETHNSYFYHPRKTLINNEY